MKKLAAFLIDRRYIILAIMIVLTIVCAYFALGTKINKDRSEYLSDESRMKQGLAIMETAFPEAEEKSTIRVMVESLEAGHISDVIARLEAIPHVSSVSYDAESPDYNKGNYKLFLVNSQFDYNTDEEQSIEAAIEKTLSEYKVQYKNNDIPATEVSAWLLIAAISLALLVLIIMSHSWLDPILFLITICLAVIINFGTNMILPYIDQMTATVGPVLQMVLSMDYSIILMNRYRKEKEGRADKAEAMKAALAGSISSIASSSLTTAVGLLALVFLSFKLGPEMGIVLAKGVFISMLCVLTVLPVMILTFDKALEKTRKKAPHIPMGLLTKFSLKAKYLMPALFALLLVGFFILQNNTAIVFADKGDDPLADIFPKDNTVVLLYTNQDEGKIPAIIREMEKDERLISALAYPNTLGREMKPGEMAEALRSLGEDSRMEEDILRMLYYLRSDEPLPRLSLAQFASFITDDILPNLAFRQYLDASVMENAGQLKQLADKEAMSAALSADEMAAFLGIDPASVGQLYLFYALQTGVEDSGQMTLQDFVAFIEKTSTAEGPFSAMFDASAMASLAPLRSFTDPDIIQKPSSAQELALMLELDENLVAMIFTLRYGEAAAGQQMSLQELVQILLSDPRISGNLDPMTQGRLQAAGALMQASAEETAFSSGEMAALIGMDPAQTEMLYILYLAEKGELPVKITPQAFMSFAEALLSQEAYAAYIDADMSEKMQQGKALMEAVLSEKGLAADEMAGLLAPLAENISENEIEIIYLFYGAMDSETGDMKMTIPQLFDYLREDFLQDTRFAGLLDQASRDNILSSKEMLEDSIRQMKGEKYSRLVLNARYPDESAETTAYIEKLKQLCEGNLGEYYLLGNSVMVSELDETFDNEYLMITLITAFAVFLVVLIVFRNPAMALILTLLVQCGVFITVTIIGAYSGSIYYLALLIVQSILMGATIDYGIVFCNFYRESRMTMPVEKALQAAYENSIHTIMTSGAIIVLVLMILGIFVSSQMTSEVCITLSLGALIAVLLILLLLPGVVICCDKVICKKNKSV